MTDIQLAGKIEFFDQWRVKGWAANLANLDTPVVVEVFDGDTLIDSFSPSLFRWDLFRQGYGSGNHGFFYELTAQLHDSRAHVLHFRHAMTGAELEGSPVTIQLSFEGQYVPLQASNLTGKRVLGVAPHADDETFGVGGALSLHCQAGDPVKIIILTDGAQADRQRQFARSDYVSLRESETYAACAALGTKDVEFWRIPDRTIDDDGETVARLAALIRDYQPGLVYVPSPMEYHPDHRASAQLVWTAVQVAGTDTNIAFYEFNRMLIANALVDITNVVDTKMRAGEAYASQQAEYPYTEMSLALNRYRSITLPNCRYAEALFVVEAEDIRRYPLELFNARQYLPIAAHAQEQPALVTIIVRTFNRPQLLREALSSIMLQTYRHFEVIVVNDGGQNMQQIIDEFAPHMPIRYVHHPHQQGRSAAANTGIQLARGKYVNFLDDDDLFYSDHVQRLVVYMEATGERVAYSDCERGIYRFTGHEFIVDGVKKSVFGLEYDRDRLFLGNFLPIMTVMFRHDLVDQAGYFDTRLEALEDWDFWLRMSKFTDFQHIPGITAEYRVFAAHPYDYDYWWRLVYEKHRQYRMTPGQASPSQNFVTDADRQLADNIRKALLEEYETMRAARLPAISQAAVGPTPGASPVRQFLRRRLGQLLED